MGITAVLPSGIDATVITISAILLTFARIMVQKFCANVAREKGIKETLKFSESCWKTLYYTSAWIAGVYLIVQGDWFPQTENCWKGFPNIPKNTDFWLFYLVQLGFYVHSLFAHLTLETRRSDFYPLLFHHIVTIGLIYGSYAVGYHRIGHLILVCHDTNDIIFEFGKLLVYQDKQKESNYVFGVFIVSWIITRLTIFPFMLIWSAWVESRMYSPPEYHFSILIFDIALLFLEVLHIYWFAMIMRMALRLFSGKSQKIEDTRETRESRESVETRKRSE